mmetsp:Transcript_143303/g.264248  ORF Transcript_143303/g.264248 Transcript_143303/m.264248 type:complete len:96 (+) Transcript_143303:141-428(+)
MIHAWPGGPNWGDCRLQRSLAETAGEKWLPSAWLRTTTGTLAELPLPDTQFIGLENSMQTDDIPKQPGSDQGKRWRSTCCSHADMAKKFSLHFPR